MQLDMNNKDEFSDFLTKLKELLSELEAFVQIRNDIKNNAAMTQDFRKKQTEINGDIAKYSSVDKEVISIGFFKKANKKDLINQLKRDLDEVELWLIQTTANLEALIEMRSIIYNLLNFLEFPRLVVDFSVTVGPEEKDIRISHLQFLRDKRNRRQQRKTGAEGNRRPLSGLPAKASAVTNGWPLLPLFTPSRLNSSYYLSEQ